MIRTLITPVLVSVLAGCAVDAAREAQDAREALKRTTSCGAPRIDPALAYQLLPSDLKLSNSLTRSLDPVLTEEGTAQVTRSVQEFLRSDWKVRVSDAPRSAIKWRDAASLMDPSSWFSKGAKPPCGETLIPLTNVEADGDVVVMLQARNYLEPPYATAIGVAILVMGGWRASGGATSERGKVHEKLSSNYLLAAMADGRTGEILWISTILLDETDSLRNPADATRLVRKAFTGM